LLDVFVFLKDIAKPGGGLQNAITARGGISKLRCLAARQYPDVEIEVHLADTATSGLMPLYKATSSRIPATLLGV